MKHYVIVNDWANEYESGTTILSVVHSMEEAKKIFKEISSEADINAKLIVKK